ncbi:hypothetical protein E2C01_088033 [Portunus trituberculatus]|uniref:Secreted protein n=1 Tax=Portunus trituberculatus TaxID=210409 RepID=A0A5B7J524_PORTR|nr:hypothetical protein [Portunus trituberculatus]
MNQFYIGYWLYFMLPLAASKQTRLDRYLEEKRARCQNHETCKTRTSVHLTQRSPGPVLPVTQFLSRLHQVYALRLSYPSPISTLHLSSVSCLQLLFPPSASRLPHLPGKFQHRICG